MLPRVVLSAFVLGATSGCWLSKPELDVSREPGHLIPGTFAAQAFRISATDTLREVARNSVPAAIRRAADDSTQDAGLRPECNRFFVRDVYLVVMTQMCGPNPVREMDARPVIAFSLGNVFLGSVLWRPEQGGEIVPFYRFDRVSPDGSFEVDRLSE